MPNRTDKRDALALSAYLSGLEIEFNDGIDPTSVSPKALPQVRPFSEQSLNDQFLMQIELATRGGSRYTGLLARAYGYLSTVSISRNLGVICVLNVLQNGARRHSICDDNGR